MTHRNGIRCLLALFTLLLPSPGCRPKKPAAPIQPVSFARELPPGELALRKVSPSEYPDFTPVGQVDPRRVLQAIDQSLMYLKAPSSQRYFPYLDITHDRAVATLTNLRDIYKREMVDKVPGDGAALNAAIRERFDVYKSVGGWDPQNGRHIGRVLLPAISRRSTPRASRAAARTNGRCTSGPPT